MIIEQAFYNLPEILTGFGYPRYEHEGGIVGAFSLALLQEFNGRNISNPIAKMHMEKLYRKKKNAFIDSNNIKRYLRCDLYVKTKHIGVGSKTLATYGWRHENWIEAKFYRTYDKSGNLKRSSTNKGVLTSSLLADLVRLMSLVPSTKDNSNEYSNVGRYLLHVYLGNENKYISKIQENRKLKDREWVRIITSEGQNELDILDISKERDYIIEPINERAKEIKIKKLNVTNYVIEPYNRTKLHTFKCILTRINSYEIRYAENKFILKENREVEGNLDAIANEIGGFLGCRDMADVYEPVGEDDDNDDIDEPGDENE